MPNRVIKDSIRCSDQIDSLTWFQEVMFYRLLVTVDDFGRYYADPQIIKSILFPKKEDLTKKAVSDGLDTLEDVGLIKRYDWDGSKYLEVKTWMEHQQRRASKSKFPDSNGNHMISNDIKCNQKKSDDITGYQMSPNTKSNTKTKTKDAPAHEEALPLESDDVLIAIQRDHDRLLDVAKEVGLPTTDRNFHELLRLYDKYGTDAVLHGLREASRMNKVSIAYVEGVLKNHSIPKGEEEEYGTIFWDEG